MSLVKQTFQDQCGVKFHQRFKHVRHLIEIRPFRGRLRNSSVRHCWVVRITISNRNLFSSFNRHRFITDRLRNSRRNNSRGQRSLLAQGYR